MKASLSHNDIHLVLKDLIDMKSKRDQSNFTLCQLAKAIGMPHSILSKLTHEDPMRRVSNPRIDTLSKIVNFFKKDGFDITIDKLLDGFKDEPEAAQPNIIWTNPKNSIPLYFFDSDLNTKIGTVEVDLTRDARGLIALVSDEFIEPMFKKGSVFIVDTLQKPEHDTLVAVQISGHEKILIRKLYIAGHKTLLKLHDNDSAPIPLFPTMKYKIIGVVIQANAKT